jgi:hypothetical protein
VIAQTGVGLPEGTVRVIGYGREWNNLMGAPLDAVTERTARRRHQDGKLYAAILEGPDAALASVVLHPGGGRVTFWDPARTAAARVQYYEDAPAPAEGEPAGTWRLTRIDRSNGTSPADRTGAISDWFLVDDDATMLQWQRFDPQTPMGRVVERRPIEDPALLSTDRPEFGEYAHLFVPDLLEQLWPGLEPLEWLGS